MRFLKYVWLIFNIMYETVKTTVVFKSVSENTENNPYLLDYRSSMLIEGTLMQI